MGILSAVTAPLRVGAHLAGSGMSRGVRSVGGYVGAHAAMNNTRFQLRSYEGRELFDSKRLDRYFHIYHRLIHQMKRYRPKHGTICPQIEKAYHRGRNHPDVLNKLLAHEIDIFARYYAEILQVIGAIQMKASDLVLQENAQAIMDLKKLEDLVKKIPEKAAEQNVTLAETDMQSWFSEIRHFAHKEARSERQAWKERVWFIKGKKVVRGFAGFIGGITGIGRLAHKMRKRMKRLTTHDIRKFDKEFTEVRQDLENGKISDVTIAHFRYMIKNYERIRKYYTEIDKDVMLLLVKMFEEFNVIQNECVIPFYASVQNIKGAKRILELSNDVKGKYDILNKELYKEESEVKMVHAHLIEFVHTCQQAVAEVRHGNAQSIQDLQKTMSINERTAHARI